MIPRWIATALRGERCVINGDGQTTRDFCYVDNAVQANLLTALTREDAALNQVYNVAVAGRTSLLDLHGLIAQALTRLRPDVLVPAPLHGDFRRGDVKHSLADIGKARRLLGYEPTHDVGRGISETVLWHVERQR